MHVCALGCECSSQTDVKDEQQQQWGCLFCSLYITSHHKSSFQPPTTACFGCFPSCSQRILSLTYSVQFSVRCKSLVNLQLQANRPINDVHKKVLTGPIIVPRPQTARVKKPCWPQLSGSAHSLESAEAGLFTSNNASKAGKKRGATHKAVWKSWIFLFYKENWR